jgi:hypothetical protein
VTATVNSAIAPAAEPIVPRELPEQLLSLRNFAIEADSARRRSAYRMASAFCWHLCRTVTGADVAEELVWETKVTRARRGETPSTEAASVVLCEFRWDDAQGITRHSRLVPLLFVAGPALPLTESLRFYEISSRLNGLGFVITRCEEDYQAFSPERFARLAGTRSNAEALSLEAALRNSLFPTSGRPLAEGAIFLARHRRIGFLGRSTAYEVPVTFDLRTVTTLVPAAIRPAVGLHQAEPEGLNPQQIAPSDGDEGSAEGSATAPSLEKMFSP